MQTLKAKKGVRVRFPPSPTGYCHVGTARMALLNYLFARKHGGTIIFRSEDTDRERSTKAYEEDIIQSIRWLGLSWDEFFRQSERTERYAAALDRLLAADKAYISEEPSKKDPSKIARVVRLRNPNGAVTFSDIIRGDITFDTSELKDFIIARAINDPLYHLSVVVDDAEMGITHVIRGEEHISNTPRQILIQQALGYVRPQYAHYPLFLGADKSKLSKRKGDVAVRDFREDGFLPAAMLNFIGILGWTPPSGREVLTLGEMIAEFELDDLHKSGAVFDMEKLRWYNRQYLQRLGADAFASYVSPALQRGIAARNIPWNDALVRQLIPLMRNSISTSADLEEAAAAGEYDYFFADPSPDAPKIPDRKSSPADAKKHLEHVAGILNGLTDFSETSVKASLWEYATAHGRGAVLWPLRYSLTGKDKSPDPFVVAAIVGKETTLRRLDTALSKLSAV